MQNQASWELCEVRLWAPLSRTDSDIAFYVVQKNSCHESFTLCVCPAFSMYKNIGIPYLCSFRTSPSPPPLVLPSPVPGATDPPGPPPPPTPLRKPALPPPPPHVHGYWGVTGEGGELAWRRRLQGCSAMAWVSVCASGGWGDLGRDQVRPRLRSRGGGACVCIIDLTESPCRRISATPGAGGGGRGGTRSGGIYKKRARARLHVRPVLRIVAT
jgi:hypothetical protein